MARRLQVSAVALVAISASACVSTPDAVELRAGATDDRQLSESAAAEALRSYVDLVNAGLRGEGTDELAESTDPACSCYALVDLIQEGTAGGGAFVGAEFSASQVRVRSTVQGTAVVRARIDVSGYQVRSSDGLLVDRESADGYVADYSVRTDGDSWQVVDVTPVQP